MREGGGSEAGSASLTLSQEERQKQIFSQSNGIEQLDENNIQTRIPGMSRDERRRRKCSRKCNYKVRVNTISQYRFWHRSQAICPPFQPNCRVKTMVELSRSCSR
ncbi:hypothetical protein J6590_024945 [Homalodisca vitripennis]|nr:hypothetical protein J6590_024945 [Homalodisca vitripennis]